MKTENLEALAQAIVEKKMALSNLQYADELYDTVEEELRELEDRFIFEFGGLMETVLQDVHKKHFPQEEILLPIAYFANKYRKEGNMESPTYELLPNEGVPVTLENNGKRLGRLAILPNPVRLVLHSMGEPVVLWSSESAAIFS